MKPRAKVRHAAHRPDMPLLEIDNLLVRYGNRTAIEGLTLRVDSGSHVAVLGPNGAGKSTLFNVIAGIVPPRDGSVRIYGSRPGRHTCIAYLPQRSQVDFRFPATVLDVVLMGCASERGLLRPWRARDRSWARACIEIVGMTDFARRPIGELSGGQQQRVFIARALAQRAELMLLDEPTAGLDMRARHALPDLLEQLKSRGVTLLLATHDIAFARDHLPRVLLLNRRAVAFGAAEDVLIPALMEAAFEGQVHLLGGGRTSCAIVVAAGAGGSDS